jgi:transposase
MIQQGASPRILIATRPVDFRRGMDALAMLVKDSLHDDPFCGALFIFRSKRTDRVKILSWDGSGLVLFYKRLESGGFIWPPIRDGSMALSPSHLSLLLGGSDWTKVDQRRVERPLKPG